MSRNLLKSSVENASFSIIFQVLFRCLTFVINAWVLRHVGHAVIGIMNVRLLLLESTILFLSREPFQRACLSRSKNTPWPQVINLMWLSVPLCILFSSVFLYIWLCVLTLGHPEYESQYAFGCWSVALSCIVELLSANVTLVAQIFCFVKLRVALDTIHIVVRTVIFLSIVVGDPSRALIAFSVAQVSSAIILSLSYYLYFYFYTKKLNQLRESNVAEFPPYYQQMEDFPFKSINELFPKYTGRPNDLLDPELCTLIFSFAKQGFVKQILTEGEKYIMSISPVLSFSEQAMYDIVNNLGSLAARFVFRPLEDSAYFYFSQMIQRTVPIKNQDPKNVAESCQVLRHLCRVVLSIGLVILIFGQSYSRTLLLFYGGEGFVGTGLSVLLMRCHCLAVVLLAINGVTECYCFATMTSEQLNKCNYVMVFFSVGFLALSYILTTVLGPVGFILSNCINMSARILYSMYYIRNEFRNSHYRPLEGLLVGRYFAGSLLVAGVICKISEVRISPHFLTLHILVGAVTFLFVMFMWAYENWSLLKLIYPKYIAHNTSNQQKKNE